MRKPSFDSLIPELTIPTRSHKQWLDQKAFAASGNESSRGESEKSSNLQKMNSGEEGGSADVQAVRETV